MAESNQDTILNRVLAAGHLLLIAVTWPLWLPQNRFPQVPFILVAGLCPRTVEQILLGLLLGSLGWMFCCNQDGHRRIASFLAAVSSFGLILIDQHRLQPWAWQFLVVLLILTTADAGMCRQCWRWLVIGIYAWSAWSKMDYGFCLYHGPFLLNGICKAVHVSATETWPINVRIAAAGAIPVFELLVALGLMWQRTRRTAVWGAALMHLGLLLSLGPLGHNHQPGVLIWNLFFLVQNWILFWPTNRETTASAPARTHSGNRFAHGIVGAALIWPVLEPFGLCDHWLAWAVYAAKPERVTVLVHNEELHKLPPHLTQYLGPELGIYEWRELRIDRWSLDALHAPIYPQDRFQVGVAVGLERDFKIDRIQVSIASPAQRWTGKRKIRQYEGQATIEQLARSYRLNALPRPHPAE